MSQSSFSVPNVRSFYNEVEQPILDFWKKERIFEKSIESRSENDHYIFYDGPPFVTGLPHYGHLLGSILKDVIPRYQTMKGKRVERVWGWDCHGIPIEEMVERKFQTKNRREIETKIGVKEFIDSCISYVTDTSGEWKWYIDRIARWVDIDNPYRTMDLNYMETVIWVFKQFYEKNLVYQGKRVSLYCTRCGTPLSNFEIAMDNSYTDLEDPSVFPKFPAKYYKTGVGVGVVIKNENGEILMVRRDEPNRDRVWGIVGGKYEEQDGGDILKTATREVKEEIGCDIKKLTYVGYSIDVFEGRIFKTHHVEAEVTGTPQVTEEAGMEKNIVWTKPADIPWEDMHIPTRNCLKDVLGLKPAERETTPTIEKPPVFIMAWTTTPWTLPANSALVVSKEASYQTIRCNGEYLIMAEDRVEDVMKGLEYTVVDTYLGKELIGNAYTPLFDYFTPGEKDYRVYHADFVSLTDGTGIIHMAPGFGEDDTALGKEIGLSMHETIDDEGKMIAEVTDYAGKYFKEADPFITEDLTKRGLMLKSGRITHSYPICYRCKTPLVYKAQDSWYVDIQKVKPQLFKNNEEINWVPEHIKNGRFTDAIKKFPDWGVSRTRYFASPVPIWECNQCEHREVLGSRAEIEAKSGKPVTNLHRPYIDEHTYACEKCQKGTMQRVKEVVDCWFESASMPFAQYHYPFENKEKFEKHFPGDYVIEYVGQTRAWFNVMHVVSTILFDSQAFKNVIVTGTIKGTDGRKMSKSLKNYPDPKATIEKYGGDAFRLYVLGSVLPYGEDLNVSEESIAQPIKDILLPFMNIYKYFALYANQHGFNANECEICPESGSCDKETALMDRWVLARVKQAAIAIDKALGEYHVPAAVAEIKPLIDDVSTWYIRRSRERFVSGDKYALSTLFTVLVQMVKIFAPIMPFTTEFVYQELKKGTYNHIELESVHLEYYPHVHELSSDEQALLDRMTFTRNVASLGQSIRVEQSIALKQPLSTLVAKLPESIESNYLELIAEELNLQEVKTATELPTGQYWAEKNDNTVSIALNLEITPALAEMGMLREVTRAIQAARKTSGVLIGQSINVRLATPSAELTKVLTSHEEKIKKATFITQWELSPSLDGFDSSVTIAGTHQLGIQIA